MQTKTIVLAVATLGFVLGGTVFHASRPATDIVVHHAPSTVTRRAVDDGVTANVCGRYVARHGQSLRFRINDAPWREFDRGGDGTHAANPRTPEGHFTLEFTRSELALGPNVVELRVGDFARTLSFDYVDDEVALPVRVDWRDVAELDVQDGHWQVVSTADSAAAIVRPVPGTEGYDRIVNVTAAFAGPRRVELDATFRHATHPGALFGFGVIPLWGGHADDEGVSPRRGWNYGIAWHYSKQHGAGVEFSSKLGGGSEFGSSTASERGMLMPGTAYHIVSEAVQRGGFWHLRLKWWQDGAAEPPFWIEMTDRAGHLDLDDEFAVALVAHRCQVEFGEVRVSRPYLP